MTDRILKIGPGVELPLSVVTSKAAILAMTGQGKTYLAKVLAEEMLNAGIQIVVGDYLGVWWGLTSSASGKSEGKNVVVFGGEFGHVPINENAGAAIADLVVNERVNAVLDVSGFEDDAPKIRFMTAFAKRLFHRNKRPLHFFLDEADEFVPQNPQREQIGMLAILKRIWQRGRIKGIGGTIISQRSAVVHKTLLSQSEMLIALRTVAPQDREALQAWFESWGTEDQIDTFEKTISNLPQYHAWFWSPRHKLFVQGKARHLQTFDSSATPDVANGLEIDEPKKRTEHDIARFGVEIERLAKEAAKEDPDLLLRQNAALEHDLAKFGAEIERLTKALAKRPERVKVERPGKPIKIAALSPRTLKEIAKTRKALKENVQLLQAALGVVATGIATDAEKVIERLDRELRRAETLNVGSKALEDRSDVRHSFESERDRIIRPEDVNTPHGTEVPAGVAGAQDVNGDRRGGLVAGGRGRILAALAQHGRMKPGRIRVLAGIESQATLTTYVGHLRKAGYISLDCGDFRITPKGLDALGSFERLPTGAALVEHWRGVLGDGGKGKIFGALLNARGKIWADEVLMNHVGISSKATFATYIGQLRALGLSERSQGGWRIASDFTEL